ncbi:hypothetical protein [Pseudoalteromonas luteoviolacea]|uniref:hypothetical protein n=1 Tax=Pseudoalteromonas luteoviolacea TaxID=43657 RepID=UPI00114DF397|nr:hypothetical protein [Pseudoalteromonas luteoviolacea]TQF66708.1 hypothetical protein FLM44_24310 [Pseudoalteromonas luteoviolacea]
MSELYTLADQALIAFAIIGIFISWKNPIATWFFLSYLMIISIDLTFSYISFEWKVHYYIFQAILNIAFIIPIVYRRNLALFLYQKTDSRFFKQAYEKQTLSSQECMILLMFLGAALVNIFTWLEILAYKHYWIDNAYIKLYVRNNIIMLIQFVLCVCFVAYAIQSKSRDWNYEATK